MSISMTNVTGIFVRTVALEENNGKRYAATTIIEVVSSRECGVKDRVNPHLDDLLVRFNRDTVSSKPTSIHKANK